MLLFVWMHCTVYHQSNHDHFNLLRPRPIRGGWRKTIAVLRECMQDTFERTDIPLARGSLNGVPDNKVDVHSNRSSLFLPHRTALADLVLAFSTRTMSDSVFILLSKGCKGNQHNVLELSGSTPNIYWKVRVNRMSFITAAEPFLFIKMRAAILRTSQPPQQCGCLLPHIW